MMELSEIIKQLSNPGIRRIDGDFNVGNVAYEFKAYMILNPEPLIRIDVKKEKKS